jgi:hypothetical protein
MSKDELCQAHVIKANDIFHAAAPIPHHGTLTRALLLAEGEGTPAPQKIELRPPGTVLLPSCNDTSLFKRWLTKRGFRILRCASRVLLAASVALSTMAAAALDDGDNDDDDDTNTDRLIHGCSKQPRPQRIHELPLRPGT